MSVMRTLRIDSLNFPIYHRAVLTVVIISHITSLVFTYSSYDTKFVPCDFFHLISLPPTLWLQL